MVLYIDSVNQAHNNKTTDVDEDGEEQGSTDKALFNSLGGFSLNKPKCAFALQPGQLLSVFSKELKTYIHTKSYKRVFSIFMHNFSNLEENKISFNR